MHAKTVNSLSLGIINIFRRKIDNVLIVAEEERKEENEWL